MHTITHSEDYTQANIYNKMELHTPISKNSFSSVQLVVVYHFPPHPITQSLSPHIHVYTSHGAEGVPASERLVKEHGMLMAWKGYE